MRSDMLCSQDNKWKQQSLPLGMNVKTVEISGEF